MVNKMKRPRIVPLTCILGSLLFLLGMATGQPVREGGEFSIEILGGTVGGYARLQAPAVESPSGGIDPPGPASDAPFHRRVLAVLEKAAIRAGVCLLKWILRFVIDWVPILGF